MEQELVAHGFVRCHTSYIVNLFFVKGVNKLELTLITGEILPISQPKRKQFYGTACGVLGRFAVIQFMEICSDILAYGYVFVFLCKHENGILRTTHRSWFSPF